MTRLTAEDIQLLDLIDRSKSQDALSHWWNWTDTTDMDTEAVARLRHLRLIQYADPQARISGLGKSVLHDHRRRLASKFA